MAQEGKYSNRYGDEYTFKVAENGVDVIWEGDFLMSRVGYANDYSKAYEAYRKQTKEQGMSLMQFEDEVHRNPELKLYSYMVESTDTITMVDPSGGPYLAKGMQFRYIKGHERTILGFESVNEHTWKIILDDLKWLEDRDIIGGII